MLIRRERAYHGMHTAGTSLAGIPANAEGYGDCWPTWSRSAGTTPTALRAVIEQIGAERVAAFFCEPVIGAGGVFPPPAGLPSGRARRSAGRPASCSSRTR